MTNTGWGPDMRRESLPEIQVKILTWWTFMRVHLPPRLWSRTVLLVTSAACLVAALTDHPQFLGTYKPVASEAAISCWISVSLLPLAW